MSLTPEQRRIRASLAAYERWSREDSKTALSRTRKAWYERFDKQVDPDGVLPLPERSRRAEAAMRAHMQRLALMSSKARKKPVPS
jgi:hypothetical protein